MNQPQPFASCYPPSCQSLIILFLSFFSPLRKKDMQYVLPWSCWLYSSTCEVKNGENEEIYCTIHSILSVFFSNQQSICLSLCTGKVDQQGTLLVPDALYIKFLNWKPIFIFNNGKRRHGLNAREWVVRHSSPQRSVHSGSRAGEYTWRERIFKKNKGCMQAKEMSFFSVTISFH